MDILIRELDQNNLVDIDRCDSTFYVDSRLQVQLEAGKMRYQIVPVTPFQKSYPPETTDYREYIQHPDRAIFLAYADDQIAGQIIVTRHWNKFANIHDLRVAPSNRRLGIGRQLMDCAVQWARIKDLAGVMLETQDINVGACLFYEQYGFRLGGLDTCLYRGIDPQLDEIALFWYLIF